MSFNQVYAVSLSACNVVCAKSRSSSASGSYWFHTEGQRASCVMKSALYCVHACIEASQLAN